MENQLRTTMRTYYQPIQTYLGLFVFTVLLLFNNSLVHAQTPCTGGNIIPFTVTSEDASKKTTNDAKIRLSGGLNGDYRIGYSVGNTYTGPDFASSPKYSTLAGGYISTALPTPTSTAGTVYTIRVYNVAGTCYTEQQYTLPYVYFNEVPKFPDIEVVAAAGGGTGGFHALGSTTTTVTFTVRNLGDTTATNVTELITIPAGLTLTGNAPDAGTTFDTGTKIWDIGTLAKGQLKSITLTFTITQRGIRFVTANTATQVNGMVQTPALAADKDSQPGNNIQGEDDFGGVCISVPFDFCDGDEYTITIPSGNYTSIQWYKDNTLITSSTAGVTINANGSITVKSTGVYSYSFPANTCPSGGCCPVKVEAGVAPDLQPLTDQVICENGTFAPVTASNTGYTGPTSTHPNGPVVYQWYNDNGTTNPTATAIAGQTGLSFTAFPTAPGTYKYKLKAFAQDHANCKDSTMITLTINPLPLAPVAQGRTYCADDLASPLTATAASGNTLQWYTSATGGTASTTAPTPSTVNASNTTAVTLQYWVSQKVDNTSCEGPRTLVTVIINPRPAPPAVTNVTYCQEETALALVATPGANQTIFWYGTNSAGGTGSTAAPVPSTLTAGTVTYYVTQKIDATGCESNRAALTVTVNPKPTAPTAQNVTYCEGATAVPLTATAVTGQTLYWYGTSATGGTASTTAPTPSTTTAGTYTYYVSFKVDVTSCESNRTPVTVLINPTPAPPTVSNVTYCQGATPTALVATGALGNTILWYQGGSASTTAPIPSTSTAGVELFLVSQKVPGTSCESAQAVITVLVNPIPVAEVIAVNSLCIGNTTQNNGKLILTRYRNSDELAYVAAPATLGTTPTYNTIPAGGIFASGLANPTTSTQNYFVRIKNSFNCTVDRTATLTKVDCGCPGGYCEPASVTKTK
jgi:hypothetical protein